MMCVFSIIISSFSYTFHHIRFNSLFFSALSRLYIDKNQRLLFIVTHNFHTKRDREWKWEWAREKERVKEWDWAALFMAYHNDQNYSDFKSRLSATPRLLELLIWMIWMIRARWVRLCSSGHSTAQHTIHNEWACLFLLKRVCFAA